MEIKLLGQGYEAVSEFSVGNQLIKFFADDSFHSFIGISAFISEGGVNGISHYISKARKHLKSITIVTGVDLKGTSQEALEALLDLKINSYVFYDRSYITFHPKIYLFEGVEKSELIIGSSNLTSKGLFANVEASLLISVDHSIESDRKIVEQLKAYFKGIFDFTDPNLEKLSKEVIMSLVQNNIVPTEAERKAIHDKSKKVVEKSTENFISKIFPKREIAKIPREFRGGKRKPKILNSEAGGLVIAQRKAAVIVWKSGPLTERDLNIPKGSNTNPTGSMLFKKGSMKGIDQRHYFRDEIFSSLSWHSDTDEDKAHLERATALFTIIIIGENFGQYRLTITHNRRTDSRSYQQKNSMTSISWGAAKNIIAKDELIGKSVSLYKNEKEGEFTLVIE